MRPDTVMDRLMRHEAAGGVLLILAAVLAMIIANSPLDGTYQGLFDTKLSV
mgnify:CR=1 FL=1